MKEKDTARTLIEKARSGDRRAFDSLIASHRVRVAHFAKTRLGALLKQKIEVDDIVQETLLRAFKSIEQFRWRGEDSFVRWLNGIAEHVIRKAAERVKRRQSVHLDAEVPAGSGGSPGKTAQREERFERLRKSLEGLSPDQREAILLSRIDGLRVKEIARRMNRSTNAVLLLISRGLSRLKDAFGETESLHLPPWSLRDQDLENDER